MAQSLFNMMYAYARNAMINYFYMVCMCNEFGSFLIAAASDTTPHALFVSGLLFVRITRTCAHLVHHAALRIPCAS
jgi:hypothetical protein